MKFPLPGMTSLDSRIRSILMLRWAAVVGQVATIFIVQYGLGIQLDLAALLIIVLAELAFNVASWLRYQKLPLSEATLLVQLLADTLFLGALLYFSGGARNPFVSLFLVPIAIAALSLPKRFAWTITSVTILLYSVLMYFYVPIHHHVSSDIHQFDLHVIGMWVNYILSAALICFLIVSVSRTLKQKDRVIQQQREKALRKEKLVAVGTLAANAAHEMGTPLSSLTLLASELELDLPENPDVQLLKKQLSRCREIVDSLGQDAQQILNGEKAGYQVGDYMHHLIDQFNLIRPDMQVDFQCDNQLQHKPLQVDKMLLQSLLTILNNAADESRKAEQQSIELQVSQQVGYLSIRIRDFGNGFDEVLLPKLGKVQVSSKASGLGLGLLLANASIERFNGKVTLENHPQQGAITTVLLQQAAIGMV